MLHSLPMDLLLARKPLSEAEKDLSAIRAGRDLSFFDLVSIDQVSPSD